MVARKWRLFKDNVTLYVPPSAFVRQRMIDAGFPPERIIVIPNMVSVPDVAKEDSPGKYVAYVGRISPGKGIGTLLTAAGKTGLPVQIAGDNSQKPRFVETAPPNARFAGLLDRNQVAGFYRNARFSVVPSICFETFGLVAAEAMSHGLPVIASKTGALPEIVEDGVTGFLFRPGNAEELASKMKLLWENPDLCRKMGKAARDRVIREYGEDLYYRRLVETYHRAIELEKAS
jgi:glycosyltransferase involved in cell wall biosynthesis